jgi:WD repeat-containing protein 35
MYCTLIKKVNVTKSDKLTKISHNKLTNLIGIGGTNGFVQVVNLDITSQNQLTSKQTLESHSSEITLLRWNDQFNKLTTCDSSGVIIVWRLNNNVWETEMINNREQSYVTDLKWSNQGHYLCFIYEDGHAIVGTVEGNRSWGNDIRNSLYLIEWSPDDNNILLASKNSNIIILTAMGQQLGELIIEPSLFNVQISSLSWWSNYISDSRNITLKKHLMLAFKNGTVALYDNEDDRNPFIIKTNLFDVNKAEWNLGGDVFAISGMIKEEDNKCGVSFYSSKGEFIKVLKAPEPIICFSWDARGTKIALETQNTIYFGLVKPKYKWCFFSNTLVFSYLSESDHHTLVFWDIKNEKINYKYVKNMIDICAKSPFCLITAQISENNYLLILSNSIGSPIDNKIINIEPVFIALNNTHAVVSNGHYVYLWQFRGIENERKRGRNDDKNIIIQGQEISINLLTKKMMRELTFFIEDIPNMNDVYNYETFNANRRTNDPITAVCLTDNYLFITCASGKANKYNLMSLTTITKYNFDEKMIKIGLSPQGQYLWAISEYNMLSIWDTEKQHKKYMGEKLEFEKKDVWSVLWSDNKNTDSMKDELSFVFLEKNKLNIIKNLEPEEVLACNGYLADFSDLIITAVKLEDLMFKPYDSNFKVEDIVIQTETRNLRDLREHIKAKMPMEDIYKFVEQNPNRKIWELLAKHALFLFDTATAEKAFTHMNDYMGLDFIKRLKTIDDDNLKRAEISQFFNDYDTAEETYNNADRKDLSINMRLKLGQWDRVINLMNEKGVVDENNMKIAYSNSADQYMDEKDYEKAEEFYKKANNNEGLINVWFATEEFDKASNFIERIPEQNEFLLFMGEKFETYGLCDEAVNCYLRYGDVKKAIDTCVLMNKWNLAVELAEKNNFFQIEGLVNKFGSILMEKGKKMDLVELYRKSHRHTEAAKILIKIAEDLKELNASPITLKKIYVVAALEMESFKTRLIDAQITNITQQTVKNTTTLDTLITSDLSNVSDKTLNNPWKGAEAYHFYMLCQSQLYQNKYKEALKTALRLVLYEKELGAKEVYRLISLSAFLNQNYQHCSKALSTLENLPNLTKVQRQKYKDLAVHIFMMNEPKNHNEFFVKCPNKKCGSEVSEFSIDCKSCGSNFSPCVYSGQSIMMKGYYKCKRCKHKCLESEIYNKPIKFCPLCHLALDLQNQQVQNDVDIMD